MVVIKSKKKAKKVVKHPAPVPAEMGLSQGPPAPSSEAKPSAPPPSASLDKPEPEAPEARLWGETVVEEEPVVTPGFRINSEEFRNVWDSDK